MLKKILRTKSFFLLSLICCGFLSACNLQGKDYSNLKGEELKRALRMNFKVSDYVDKNICEELEQMFPKGTPMHEIDNILMAKNGMRKSPTGKKDRYIYSIKVGWESSFEIWADFTAEQMTDYIYYKKALVDFQKEESKYGYCKNIYWVL